MKWNKYRMKTTTEAVDLISYTLGEMGIEGIEIEDKIPLSDEDKKKIFDRFFRVDKARTRQKGGLGLGLSLAKQIVEAYNGKITVEDNKPKGTKFIIRIRVDSTISNPAKIFQKL